MYPVELKLIEDIGHHGMIKTENRNVLIPTDGAITIHIRIRSENYPKEAVSEKLKEIFEKAVEYYR